MSRPHPDWIELSARIQAASQLLYNAASASNDVHETMAGARDQLQAVIAEMQRLLDESLPPPGVKGGF